MKMGKTVGIQFGYGLVSLYLLNNHKYSLYSPIYKKDKPPWDNGEVQPLLRYSIESGEIKLPKASLNTKVLIPGCGKGYDVAYFGSLGYNSLGLDISPEGIISTLNIDIVFMIAL